LDFRVLPQIASFFFLACIAVHELS